MLRRLAAVLLAAIGLALALRIPPPPPDGAAAPPVTSATPTPTPSPTSVPHVVMIVLAAPIPATSSRPFANTAAPYSLTVEAGSWVIVGNPSGIYPAQIAGADSVFTYSPAGGYQPAQQLSGGSGAWVLANRRTTITVTPALGTPASAVQPAYPSGWNLVSGPDGSTLVGATGSIYTWQPGDTMYESYPADSPLHEGWGYWAYFPTGGYLEAPP